MHTCPIDSAGYDGLSTRKGHLEGSASPRRPHNHGPSSRVGHTGVDLPRTGPTASIHPSQPSLPPSVKQGCELGAQHLPILPCSQKRPEVLISRRLERAVTPLCYTSGGVSIVIESGSEWARRTGWLSVRSATATAAVPTSYQTCWNVRSSR